MHYQTLNRRFMRFFCGLAVALLVVSEAAADEWTMGSIVTIEPQISSIETLDLSLAAAVETELGQSNNLSLPDASSQLSSFVEKCAELEAIPLIEMSSQEDKQVFLGINFDGFLGIYARL